MDFRKGCYVGQELTARTYHLGVVRKRIVPIRLDSDTRYVLTPKNSAMHCFMDVYRELPPGSEIKTVIEDGKDAPKPRGSGKLLSNVGGLGLAMLRLEHVNGVRRGVYRFDIPDQNGPALSASPLLPSWWPFPVADE